jgi:hypothetical protein
MSTADQKRQERLADLLRESLIEAWVTLAGPHGIEGHGHPDLAAIKFSGRVGYQEFARCLAKRIEWEERTT